MTRNHKILFVSFCLVTTNLFGCVIGQKFRYHDVAVDLQPKGQGQAISLATVDAREYITDGEKDPTYVGLLRNGYGIPFNVHTESDKPLAQDMTQVLNAAFIKNGFATKPVITNPSEPREQVMKKLLATKPNRIVVLVLKDWYSHVTAVGWLQYDVAMIVYDESGKQIANEEQQGNDQICERWYSCWPSQIKENVPGVYKKRLEALLNSPKIVAALKTAPAEQNAAPVVAPKLPSSGAPLAENQNPAKNPVSSTTAKTNTKSAPSAKVGNGSK